MNGQAKEHSGIEPPRRPYWNKYHVIPVLSTSGKFRHLFWALFGLRLYI